MTPIERNFTVTANIGRSKRAAEYQHLGFNFAMGVHFYIAVFLTVAVALVALIHWIAPSPRDATDSPTARSGVTLRTDYGTGCQYLETSEGGITPRLDRTGRQVCAEP